MTKMQISGEKMSTKEKSGVVDHMYDKAPR